MQSYRSHAIINARVNLDEEPIDHQEGSGGKLSRSHLNAGNSSDQVTVFDINDNDVTDAYAIHWENGTVFSATAVPEPETYAMMLTGLALLGFAAHRRKQKQTAAA